VDDPEATTLILRKRKRTPEERAAEQARRDDLTRRLQEAIARYRGLAERRRATS
jgi:hypothetical protein